MLLITKLYAPRVRASQIDRPDLSARIDVTLDRKLIVIAAAAGFGKTSLVAAWAAAHADQACWLSLDDGDNDPARFLAYLLAAIQTRYPDLGVELLAALQSPQPPRIDQAVAALHGLLARCRDLGLTLISFNPIEPPR